MLTYIVTESGAMEAERQLHDDCNKGRLVNYMKAHGTMIRLKNFSR